MIGQIVDPDALDSAISSWLGRLGGDLALSGSFSQIDTSMPAYGNAIHILLSEEQATPTADNLELAHGHAAFRIGWDLAINCASAVLADPFGDPMPVMKRRFDDAREELLAEIADVARCAKGGK